MLRWGLFAKPRDRDLVNDPELFKTNPEQHSPHLTNDWTEVVDVYFSERSRNTNGKQVRKTLNATLEESAGYIYPPGKFRHSRLHCFERDWNFASTHKPLALSQPQETSVHQPSKKRKLKGGKALALESVLDRL